MTVRNKAAKQNAVFAALFFDEVYKICIEISEQSIGFFMCF